MTTTGSHQQTTPAAAPATTAMTPPPKPPTAIQTFRGLLEKMKPQIALALPAHLDANRMLRVVLTTVQRNPKLLSCTKDSLLGCIVQCAQLGLEPDGLLGHAYLIPFENRRAKPPRTECQLIVGYKGLLKLARQSGEVANVAARIVFDRDAFDYEYGLHERLVHKPYIVKSDETDEKGNYKDTRGLPVFAYAIFWLKDGSISFEVMGYQDIERIRRAAPGGESDAWTNHWDEMAKKTVLRKASKMSPASVEDRLAKAISLDELAQAGLPQNLDDPDGLSGDDPAGALPAREIKVEVGSTLKQRKDVLKLIEKARVAEADVSGWYKKQRIDDLTSEEADDAAKRLNEVMATEGAVIS